MDISNCIYLKSEFFSVLFYDILCIRINEHYRTDVHSPLHITGLPDFQSESDTTILTTGNRNTFVMEQPIILLQKNYISNIGTSSRKGAHRPGYGCGCGYGLSHSKSTHVSIWFSPSLKYFVLKSLQVGVRTNPPDWFQLCLKELNPCDHKKRWIPALRRRDKEKKVLRCRRIIRNYRHFLTSSQSSNRNESKNEGDE